MSLALGYTFQRNDIIKAALRRVRAYDPEDATTISTVQYNNAAETLNLIVAAWQADGMQVWTVKTSTAFTMTASQGTYTIGYTGADIDSEVGSVRPLEVYRAWLRNTSDNSDVPLKKLVKQDYDELNVKTQESRPTSFYFDAEFVGTTAAASSTGRLYLWPEPDASTVANYTLYLVYQRPLLDFQAATDELDMPQEWHNAVRLALAAAIAPEYGIPVIEYDRLQKEADEAKELAMGWDRERGSILFQPKYRFE